MFLQRNAFKNKFMFIMLDLSSVRGGAPAGPASGTLERPSAPAAGPAGAPLLPLMPLLWRSIHSCSLPSVAYYCIFDLMYIFH